jgi:crotonobetainyl-CoA:carnitine CoA-transferase CaiB-like acyl-CoA transferase
MIVAHTEKYWVALLRAVERSELARDPRFVTNADRLQHREALDGELARAFTGRTLDDWTRRLTAADVLFAPVRDFGEVFSDPFVREQMVQTVAHPTAGEVAVLRNPIRMSSNPPRIRCAPPRLGEHTEEVLQRAQRR